MVFPAQKCSPFSGEGDFRSQVIEYIKKNFAAFLGADVALLDLPDGLDLIQAKYPLRASVRVATSTHVVSRPEVETGAIEEKVLAVF